MWPEVVIVVPPRFDDLTRFSQAREHVLVEAFVAQLAVEAFDECVLDRLARLNVVPPDAVGCPSEHCHTGKFCSIIADNHPGRDPLEGDAVELTHHSNSTQ